MQRGSSMVVGIIIVAALLIGGALIFGGDSGSENSAVNNQTQSNETVSTENVSTDSDNINESVTNESSRYVEYSEGVLEEHAEKRRVLYFYASWCPTCRPLDADLRSQSNRIPEDVVIVRVNYKDSDTDGAEDALADEYDVAYQHTFVEINEEGNEVQKWNGGQIEEVLSRLK